MPKAPKNTPKTTPTASSTDASLLTLAALNDLQVPQRVELYVTTENKQRIGFLLQGKILHSLGIEGLELLRAAGIKPSSLSNARKAEWVFGTFTHPERTATIRAVRIHNGSEAAEFSESLYDTLTLRQCELLQIAFTNLGQPKYRPNPQEATDMLARPDWDEDIECYLLNGTDRAGVQARHQENERKLQAERERVADMERQIAAQTERDLAAAAAAENAPPPPPAPVSFNEPPAAVASSAEAQEEPATNIVPFTATSDAGTPARSGLDDGSADTPVRSGQPEGSADTPVRSGPEADITAEEDDDTATDTPVEEEEDDDTSDSLTPEEIGSAVADATDGIAEHNQSIIEHLGFTLHDLEESFDDNVSGLDIAELTDIKSRLERLLDAVNLTIAAKAAPQDELPAASPVKQSRSRKAKLAA